MRITGRNRECALWRKLKSRICRHEREILAHGVDLVVELAWERHEFVNESITPLSPLEKVDALFADRVHVFQETGRFRGPIRRNRNNIDPRLMLSFRNKRRTIRCV